MSAYERLRELAGDAVKGSNGRTSLLTCPAHEDRRPSLVLSVGENANAVVHCHTRCTPEEVMAAWGQPMAALFDSYWESSGGNGNEPTAIYTYTDENRTPLFEVGRFVGKRFFQRRPGRQDWKGGIQGVRRVLYRLPEVIAAIQAGVRIYVVEGEEDVHAIERNGGVATCNPGGAGKWRPEFTDLLRGADVVVVQDRDKPGHEHAAPIASDLGMPLVGARTGKDARDHLHAGHALDEFVPVVEPAVENPRYAGRRVDLVAMLALPERATPWRVEHLVADGTVTIIAAEGGAGKSWFAQACCEGVHAGESVVGLDCAQGVALYVDAEMGTAMFVDRLRSSGATGAEYEYLDAMGLDVSRKDDLAWIKGQIEAVGAKLVVMDSLRRLTPSKAENDSDDMAPVIGDLAKLARDTGAAIIVIHHKGDGEKLFRGSSAIQNQCDALFGLQRPEDDPEGPLRHLWCPVGKGAKRPRYSPHAADVWLKIDDDDGSLTEAEVPDAHDVSLTVVATVADEIVAALPFETKQEAAAKVKRRTDDSSFRAAWRCLRDTKRLEKTGGWWSSPPRDLHDHPPGPTDHEEDES